MMKAIIDRIRDFFIGAYTEVFPVRLLDTRLNPIKGTETLARCKIEIGKSGLLITFVEDLVFECVEHDGYISGFQIATKWGTLVATFKSGPEDAREHMGENFVVSEGHKISSY